MKMDEIIARINDLYHKSKSEGLSEQEKEEQNQALGAMNVDKEEQAKLRKLYIENVRGNLRSTLDSISIQNEDGSVENLGEKYHS